MKASGSDGQRSWYQLFDPEEVEHACDAIRDAVAERGPDGGLAAAKPDTAGTLRTRLASPLLSYIEDHLPPPAPSGQTIVKDGAKQQPKSQNLNASQGRLALGWARAQVRGVGLSSPVHIAAAQELYHLVQKITSWLEDECPIVLLDAEATRSEVREAWRDFITQGAAYRLYNDGPAADEQRRDAPKKKRGTKPQPTESRWPRLAGVLVQWDELSDQKRASIPYAQIAWPAGIPPLWNTLRDQQRASMTHAEIDRLAKELRPRWGEVSEQQRASMTYAVIARMAGESP